MFIHMNTPCTSIYKIPAIIIFIIKEAVSKVVNSTWEAAFLWNRGIMDFTVPCDDMPRVEFYVNGWGDVLCMIFVRLAVDDLWN